jgi:hypothetical protein
MSLSRAKKMFLLCFCMLSASLLAGCRTVEPQSMAPSNVIAPPPWNEYVASLPRDDVGAYRVVVYRKTVDEDGSSLSLEERYYVELQQTRFVAEQQGRYQLLQSGDVSSMSFDVYRGGELLERAGTLKPPLITRALFCSRPTSMTLARAKLTRWLRLAHLNLVPH